MFDFVSDDPLNICVLYDERSTFTKTVYEHLNAFKRYSRHQVFYLPASSSWAVPENTIDDVFDLNIFDVIITHYSIRHCLDWHFSEPLVRKLVAYEGLKIAFIQDEYDLAEHTRGMFERIGYNIVYTCVPEDGRQLVYPAERFPRTAFLPTLTGYVPEDPALESATVPMAERAVRIAYRGRELPAVYGLLGREKWRIGVEMKRLAAERGVLVDIEVDDARRIYGSDWYRFLGSARATLGTESGANVFDDDGSLRAAVDAAQAREPDVAFDELHRRFVAPHEGRVRMNQVSPKIFEAMRLRTALVLFEGEYSGVVVPERHYIPLRKDLSNADEVFARLEDLNYLETLTARAYDECIASGRYSYRAFVEGIERDIAANLPSRRRATLFAVPVAVRAADGAIRFVAPTHPAGFALTSSILSDDLQREQMAAGVEARLPAALLLRLQTRSKRTRMLGALWRMLPVSLRAGLRTRAQVFLDTAGQAPEKSGLAFRAVRMLWRNVVPQSVRHRLQTILRSC